MPTPSEQKALAFIAIVILLGGAVRVLRAGSTPTATTVEQQQVARQAHAADSAATAQEANKGKSKARTRKPKPGDTLAHVVAGVASVPPTFARPDQPNAKSPYGYPPPGPRIDVDYRGKAPPASTTPTPEKLDIDHASAAEIEKLPRIGPAMARRIVANRDSLGPFSTLEGLRRVKGMGPSTLKLIAELVSFGARGR